MSARGVISRRWNTLDAPLATKGGLAVRVTVDGTTLSPPQPLGAAPFAARARVADSVEGATVGTAAPASMLVASAHQPHRHRRQAGRRVDPEHRGRRGAFAELRDGMPGAFAATFSVIRVGPR